MLSEIIRYWLESVTDNGPVVNDFIDWCERFLLNINVSKTNEMITDFRKKPFLLFLFMARLLKLSSSTNT